MGNLYEIKFKKEKKSKNSPAAHALARALLNPPESPPTHLPSPCALSHWAKRQSCSLLLQSLCRRRTLAGMLPVISKSDSMLEPSSLAQRDLGQLWGQASFLQLPCWQEWKLHKENSLQVRSLSSTLPISEHKSPSCCQRMGRMLSRKTEQCT